MRNMLFIGCVALAALCACESEPEDIPIPGYVWSTNIQIVLTDSELNDCLNPESPSFLGEEYTKGILTMYLNAGKKTLYKDKPLYTYEGGVEKEWITIYPPYRVDKVYGKINQNTMGYYYIQAYLHVTEKNGDIIYSYIQYPDGKEDEIKVQLYSSPTLLLMDRIWINGELAYSMSPRKGSLSMKEYYNPEYYPFLVPRLDDDGKQIGDLVQPEGGTCIIVIKKK